MSSSIKQIVPRPIKRTIKRIFYGFGGKQKYDDELAFWKRKLDIDGGVFQNKHYERIMLGMAEQPDCSFVEGKVVADFGCGPRGSLCWATAAACRIGIDVLADAYAEAFKENITSHGIIYVKSTERVIPLPTSSVDYLFTLNAIDHVDRFDDICQEIKRILRPGAEFIGSFNLDEPATVCEPQQLTEALIKETLLDGMEVISYRVTSQGPKEDIYQPFFQQLIPLKAGTPGLLWVRARRC